VRKPKANRKFDALAFKEQAQARIYEEIKDMTPAQQIAYYEEATRRGPLAKWWQGIRRQSARTRATAGRRK